ncbi:hypothetical protein GIB67_016652 [Kingdonia uniflora]|uniref:RNase H type-1 domain-containing protein n=1 Tax=Kingdonia uniflora TaxID=39325 RepID=A0A7J7MZB0_9MAGN|nr:hypothetical protein GIB67_016652 [Kingdonia uniflora]
MERIKINTDGAALGNPGKGGIGVVFRSENWDVIGALAGGHGIVVNFFAGCRAILDGMKKCSSFRWEIAWVESDSVAAIQVFQKEEIPWLLEAVWRIT